MHAYTQVLRAHPQPRGRAHACMHTHRYCELIRNREAGDHSEAELRERFTKLDEDGSGKVDMSEYLQWSLRDALTRSSDRVVDLFRAWDEDRSGAVDKKEFRKAIRAMGFDIPQRECDAVFDSLDEDKSGSLEYKELNAMLRKGLGSDATKANLKRAPKQADRSRGAKLTAKATNVNYVASRAAALPPMVKLDSSTGKSLQQQASCASPSPSCTPTSLSCTHCSPRPRIARPRIPPM